MPILSFMGARIFLKGVLARLPLQSLAVKRNFFFVQLLGGEKLKSFKIC